MPLSPIEALKLSPAAEITLPERVQIENIERVIDEGMKKEWVGGTYVARTLPISLKVLSTIVRDYESAGWNVSPQPIDGKTAKADMLLKNNHPCEFLIMLQPRWWVVESAAKAPLLQ